MEKEHIFLASTHRDDWICACGNEPHKDGFFTCDAQGNEVEPTKEQWDGILYVCLRCGRIIHQHTLQVVGRNKAVKLL